MIEKIGIKRIRKSPNSIIVKASKADLGGGLYDVIRGTKIVAAALRAYLNQLKIVSTITMILNNH